jgi:hypothetical protein
MKNFNFVFSAQFKHLNNQSFYGSLICVADEQKPLCSATRVKQKCTQIRKAVKRA